MEEDFENTTVHKRKSKRSKCCSSILQKLPRRKQIKIYFALFLSTFGSEFANAMLFPFLPFMVQFLLPDIDPSSVGKYAGMIASAMFLGKVLGSYFWGALSDSFGYKPVLIVSGVLLGVFIVLFGLSVSFPMAIAMRFMMGLVNGISCTTKASMSANCSNENQAFGMSVLAAAYGIGLVLGPAVSGVIADPIGQYHLNISDSGIRNLLTKYPYSLPCFVNALICFVAAVCVFFLLPGNKKLAKSSVIPVVSSTNSLASTNEQDNESTTNDSITNNSNGDLSPLLEDEHDSTSNNSNEEQKPDYDESNRRSSVNSKRKLSFILTLIPGRRESVTLQYAKIPRSLTRKKDGSVPLNNNDQEEETLETADNDTEELLSTEKQSLCSRAWWRKRLKSIKASIVKSLRNLKLFFCDHVTRMAILIYCIFSFAAIGFDEIYSVWCATPAYLGGLNFSLSEIGLSLSIVGFLIVPFSFTLSIWLPCTQTHPIIDEVMERRIGTIRTLTIGLGVLIFCVVVLPNVHFFVSLEMSIVLWIVLCTLMFLIGLGIVVGFCGSNLLVNNSVTFDKLGSVNGLATVMTSVFRVMSPLFAGGIYSASLSDGIGFPLDYHLIFIIFGIIFLLTLFMVSSLPKSINHQMVSEENQTQEDTVQQL